MTMLTSALISLQSLGQPVAERDAVLQSAALCLRSGPDGPEVLMVTSLGTGRWVLPKGWPMKGRTLAGAALREAWEEAGVIGQIADTPVGSFSYEKLRKGRLPMRCRVEVFRVTIDQLADQWPECKRRKRCWMPVQTAAGLVAEPSLRTLLAGISQV